MAKYASRGRMLALVAVGFFAILLTSSAHGLNRSMTGFGPELDTANFDAGDDDSHPAWSPDGRKIAFVRRNDRRYHVYVMDADGRNKRRLSVDASRETSLAWSPDGTAILFESSRNGASGISVVRADGSNERRLTRGEGKDNDPSWSPDGRSIVFASRPRTEETGHSGIYLMADDGTNRRRITAPSNDDTSPALSPDGTRIAFVRARSGVRVGALAADADIYVVDADGSNERRVTSGSAPYHDPVWSPDGRTIAFGSGHFDGHLRCGCKIFSVEADGADERQLTAWDHLDSIEPAWSPDGRTIAFVVRATELGPSPGEYSIFRMNAEGGPAGALQLTYIRGAIQRNPVWSPQGDRIALAVNRGPGREGSGDIYTIDPYGRYTKALTRSRARDVMPAWSPDGRKIAFTSNRHGKFDIYVVDADGGNLLRLTKGGDYFAPTWSPDGTRIAFGWERRPPDEARNAFDWEPSLAEIQVVDADGSNPHPTRVAGSGNREPAWSPDGKTIVFQSDRGRKRPTGINLVDVESGVERRVTPDAVGGRFPSWSPDGRTIAFATNPRGAARESGSTTVGDQIYTIDANGRHVRRLTRNSATDSVPAWSPDGSRIVFQSTQHAPGHKAYANLWVMNSDGSGLRRLTDDASTDSNPAWSPDGRKIAFDSTRNGNLVIHVINADGSGRHLLTRRAFVG